MSNSAQPLALAATTVTCGSRGVHEFDGGRADVAGAGAMAMR